MAATTHRDRPLRLVRRTVGHEQERVAPRRLRRIVVPVDGSPFSERALPVAAWVSRALGTSVHLLEVVDDGDGADGTIHYLDELAHRHNAASWDVARDGEPGAAIVAASVMERPSLVCLATHGRDRSAAALGSVAMQVLDRAAEPVMLVGPRAGPPCAGDAPVVVAVDGAPEDPAVVAVAAEWATRLNRPLVVATVAEPVPSSFRGDPAVRRARGPADPEAYVAAIASDVVRTGFPVDTRVVYDPVSVRDGVLRLVDRTAAVLVLGTHHRVRPVRAVLGSHAARIVHDVEVPALVVPLDAGG